MSGIAVVGASLAGVNAARGLRARGYDGRVVVFGAEPHQPYDRPPLSKELLRGAWEPGQARLAAHEADASIEWRLGRRVRALDAAGLSLVTDAGEERFADGLVVASGATARTLPGPALGGVHVLRTLDDAIALSSDLALAPEHVVVVGSGFIGAEAAASARALGLQVTVVELAPEPFVAGLGADIAKVLVDLHRSQGITLVSGVGVAATHGDGRVREVELSDGRVLPADVVVVGLGVHPETTWLQGSGLALDDGVVCDATLQAAPRVMAAGDIARWPDANGRLRRLEHWDNAIQQGRHAAAGLVADLEGREREAFERLPWMWSDQFGAKVQVFGTARDHDEARVVHRDEDRGRIVVLFRRGDLLAGVGGVNATKRLLGLRALVAGGASWSEALEVGEAA